MSRSLLQLVVRHAESLVSAPDSDADAELLVRFSRTRDESAFAELLRRHGPMVWAVCRQSLPDNSDAEDAFQATFLALIRSPESVRTGNALAGWLHGVAVRVVRKLKRSAVRRKQREERAANGEADHAVAEGRWEALIAAVHEEVQRLPASMRIAFVLCELEGLRQPDVAARLGCKPGTLTSRLTRARQLLIDRLSRRGLAPSLLGTLSLGVATACAAPPPVLIESTLALIYAGEAVSPAILNLVQTVKPMTRTKLVVAALLVAVGLGTALFPASNAQQPQAVANQIVPVEVAVIADEKVPIGLQYVPADAALFAHIDAAKLWNGKLGKSLRDADAKTFEGLVSQCKSVFGAVPADLKSVTIFIPTLKKEPAVGIVLVFNQPYDQAKLKAGMQDSVPKDVKTSLVVLSDTTAVLLVNLDADVYGKPQPADAKGPLSATIKAAAAGKHLIALGSTIDNLPDVVRGELMPEGLKPLLKADAISAFIGMDKEVTLDIHVKAPNEARAKDAAKSLTAMAGMAGEYVGEGIKAAKSDSTLTEIVGVFEALQASLKDAKVTTEGDTAHASVKVTAELPYALAYVVGKQKATDAAGRAQSTNNLKQIGIAMHGYHDATGTLPPAAVCDKTGKPLLSWRVLILPYIEQEVLYKEFKLDEAWDSEHNKKLIAKMPKIYGNPTSTTAKANETHYRVFVGKGAAFQYLKGSKFNDITDGLSNTIMVATAKDAVIWTKPDELEFDPEKDMMKLLGFFPSDVCIIGFADGSVRAVSKTITKKTLHAAITANGGEVIKEE